MTSKDVYYRKLAATNRLIANSRECIARQEAVVIAKADRGGHGESVRLLRCLKRSLLLLVQSRAMLIEQLMRWPNYYR